jgi:hypothetical protein
VTVCASAPPPADLPFSDRAKQGFENRIAEIVADGALRPRHGRGERLKQG